MTIPTSCLFICTLFFVLCTLFFVLLGSVLLPIFMTDHVIYGETTASIDSAAKSRVVASKLRSLRTQAWLAATAIPPL